MDSRPLLLAIGVVSTPLLPKRRSWLRAAALRYAEPAVVQRFVVGCPATGALIAEHVAHGDLVFVGMRDGRLAACIEKSFAWWSVAALVLFPKVTFIAKTDHEPSGLVEDEPDDCAHQIPVRRMGTVHFVSS